MTNLIWRWSQLHLVENPGLQALQRSRILNYKTKYVVIIEGLAFKTQQNPRKSSTFKRIQLTLHPQGSAFQLKSWGSNHYQKHNQQHQEAFAIHQMRKHDLCLEIGSHKHCPSIFCKDPLAHPEEFFSRTYSLPMSGKKRTFTGFSPHKLLFKWPSKPYQIELAQCQTIKKQL